MKKFLLLLLITTFAKAQTIKGNLISAETKEPVSYATVKIESLKKSVTSKQNGSFQFKDDVSGNLILEVEAFGYENLKINSSQLNNNPIIELKVQAEELPDLIIPSSKAKVSNKIYGRTSEGSGLIKASSQNYHKDDYDKGNEFGMVVNNKGLSEIESFHIHITGNDSKKLVFQLQFYETKNGKPSKKINHENIYFTITNKSTGWQVFDLSERGVYIDDSIKKFAFTLKLVDASFEKEYTGIEFNAGTAISNQMIIKFSEYENWSKIPINIPMYLKAKVYK